MTGSCRLAPLVLSDDQPRVGMKNFTGPFDFVELPGGGLGDPAHRVAAGAGRNPELIGNEDLALGQPQARPERVTRVSSTQGTAAEHVEAARRQCPGEAP